MSFYLPESVANAILKVHKLHVVKPKQISGVEVQVSFLHHVTEPLLLRLLLVAGVPDKGRPPSDPSNQEARLA